MSSNRCTTEFDIFSLCARWSSLAAPEPHHLSLAAICLQLKRLSVAALQDSSFELRAAGHLLLRFGFGGAAPPVDGADGAGDGAPLRRLLYGSWFLWFCCLMVHLWAFTTSTSMCLASSFLIAASISLLASPMCVLFYFILYYFFFRLPWSPVLGACRAA